jgi:hypothetical protein
MRELSGNVPLPTPNRQATQQPYEKGIGTAMTREAVIALSGPRALPADLFESLSEFIGTGVRRDDGTGDDIIAALKAMFPAKL